MEVVIDTNDDQWGYVQSNFDNLDAELENAKKHPFKVQLEYDRRFRVWSTVIERNRHFDLNRYTTRKSLLAMIVRYVALDIRDYQRLSRRAEFEFLYIANDPDVSNNTLIVAKNLLKERRGLLEAVLTTQLTYYERKGEVDIIHHFKNGWKELK